jgi:hypothetical protein
VTANKKTQLVRVRLHLPSEVKPSGPAHIRLAIDDVSLADRPAIPCQEVELVASDLDGIVGPHELHPSLLPWKSYAVRAHVDWSGDGTLAPGDLVTQERTVLPPGAPADMNVDVDVAVL